MTRRFKPPIYASKSGSSKGGAGKKGAGDERIWTLNIGEDEQAMISRLLAELRGLLTSDEDPDSPGSPLLQRLFPQVYTDDEEKEAEYQRLMREELVASRLHQIDAVVLAIGTDGATLDEGGANALLQSVNAVRVVLGTLLDVGEDDDVFDDATDDEFEGERQLYGYLSWLLEWIVKSFQT